jgi:hypothetical protein
MTPQAPEDILQARCELLKHQRTKPRLACYQHAKLNTLPKWPVEGNLDGATRRPIPLPSGGFSPRRLSLRPDPRDAAAPGFGWDQSR